MLNRTFTAEAIPEAPCFPAQTHVSRFAAVGVRATRVRDVALERASEDASFRRYFRIASTTLRGSPWTRRLIAKTPGRCQSRASDAEAGVQVRESSSRPRASFLLLSDLGTTTYLKALDERNAMRFSPTRSKRSSGGSLRATRTCCPHYDEALLRRELGFSRSGISGATWASSSSRRARVARDRFRAPSARASRSRKCTCIASTCRAISCERTKPGVIDFPNEVYGAITLTWSRCFRDAFVSWPEERVLDWSARYWSARGGGLPVHGDFRRLLPRFRVDGPAAPPESARIFARIHYRDGSRVSRRYARFLITRAVQRATGVAALGSSWTRSNSAAPGRLFFLNFYESDDPRGGRGESMRRSRPTPTFAQAGGKPLIAWTIEALGGRA